LRHASKHRGQRLPDLVHPRAQEPPVTPGCQRFVLGVHRCDQLLEQVADPHGPVPSLVVECAVGQKVPPAHEVDQAGTSGGHERARCPEVSAVRTDGSCVLVAVRVSISSAPASPSQADFLRDLQINQAAKRVRSRSLIKVFCRTAF
jgi:hypothetical protein